MEPWWSILKTVVAFLLAVVLTISTVGCRDRVVGSEGKGSRLAAQTQPEIVISEVSPPKIIQELRQVLDRYHPQVTIRSPQPDEILEDNTVTVQLQVQDLPIFKNPKFGLGPHLHVILDNQPYTTVYDLDRPLVLSDLSPGTHTLRVFASLPWFESFKNEGAYAQTTFHVYTRSDDNSPQSTLPLLTYNQPQGNYGTQPILLDFYLTNAPLHLIAQESKEDDILDWQIRCTIDGKSFTLDRWQPLYLKGFQPGKNWIELEFLDELGNPVNNAFNQTIRVITYEPGTEDSLSQLMAGELSREEALAIVDPHYVYEEETPQQTPILEPTPESIEQPLDVTIPETVQEPVTLPEMLEEPVTLPEMLEEPVTLPEMLEEPVTLPEMLEEPVTLPEMLEEPVTLPETQEDVFPAFPAFPEVIEFPKDLLVPAAEPESMEELQSTPEPSEEDVLLEEEHRFDRTSDEIEVPTQENATLESAPLETEDRLPEQELAPIESEEELPIASPQTPNLEEILPDSPAQEPIEPIELQTQLEPTLEDIVESDESASPTPEAIETPEPESLTDATLTDRPLEVEQVDSPN